MTQKTKHTGNFVQDADAVYDTHGKLERTVGLNLVDTFIYPVVNNFGVFAISVGATYLTSYGNEMGGAFGKMMYDRGEWLVDKYQQFGLGEEAADMAKMVTFSFLDGCLLAPFVKIMEDNRENMAKQIDTWLGTKPEDESVYAAEPKQSWLSVLGGRAITAGIVVPVAVALNQKFGQEQSVNAMLFDNGGKWLSEQAEKHFGKHYDTLAAKLGEDKIYVELEKFVQHNNINLLDEGSHLKISEALQQWIEKNLVDKKHLIGVDGAIDETMKNMAVFKKASIDIPEDVKKQGFENIVEHIKENMLKAKDITQIDDGKQKLEGLFKTAVFEAFYTSVCTAGLYYSSRFIAGLGADKDKSYGDEIQPIIQNNAVPFNRVKKDNEQSITVERLQEMTLTPQLT